MMTRHEILVLEQRTAEAYSRSRYTDAGWVQIIKRLDAEGLNVAEIEWVLRSKHMRWTADHANRRHSVTAADFNAYVVAPNGARGWDRLIAEARREVAKETVPQATTGADLAGACEGEQIADLIDLARKVAKGGTMTDFCHMSLRAQQILAEIERRAK